MGIWIDDLVRLVLKTVLYVIVDFYISTFVLSKLYSSFFHATFWPSEIHTGQPEFLCALLL